MKMFPPSTPLPHTVINPMEHRVATGHSEGRPAARVRTTQSSWTTALECKKLRRLGFRAEEPFESTENWVVFKAPISKLGCSQIVVILFGFLKRFWAIAVLGSSYKCACVFWPSFSGCLREGDLQLCQEHNKGITLIGNSMGHSKRRPSCNSHRFQVQAGCIIHLSQVLLSPFFLFLFFFPAVWASCSFPVLLNR